ncbi:MAG: hypothetical protein JWR35_582 [Marmoricola sp.]|jgi:hypothetical protein|nr:hypothetical protein [Marmoricola sp.]
MRTGAAFAAAAVVALSGGPALAATTVSQATAEGVVLGIAGNGTSLTGTVAATNDGSGETKTGVTNPPISVLQGQSLVTTGVIAQDATATVANRDGHSAACAGLAGPGATLAAVGSTNCLTPGNAVSISLGSIDLSHLITIDPNSALGPLGAILNGPLASLLAPVTAALSSALSTTPLGQTGLTASVGAIQASCTAAPGTASGDANIADVTIDANLLGQKINLVTLPANPAPNQGDVVLDLTRLTNPILNALEADLHTSLGGVADPLNLLLTSVQNDIINAILPQLSAALAPLTTQLLSLKLNQQTITGGDTIDVKALDLKVLPGLSAAGVPSLLSLLVGHVTCGPNGRTSAPTTTPTPTTNPPGGNTDVSVPTSVPAGLAGSSQGSSNAPIIAAGALAALLAGGAGTGMFFYRRRFSL